MRSTEFYSMANVEKVIIIMRDDYITYCVFEILEKILIGNF